MQLVANDRTGVAERVLLRLELVRAACGVARESETAVRQLVIAQVGEGSAAEVIRSTARHDIDDSARVVAELRVVAVGDELELADRLERKRKRNASATTALAEEVEVSVGAVDLDVHARRSPAADGEGAARRHFRDRADKTTQRDEIGEVAAQ